MTEIAEGKLGTVGSYDVAFAGGKLVVSLKASADGLSAGVNLGIDAKVIVDALFAKLPKNIITVEIQAAVDAAIASS